jgi:hypothetical protein
MAKFVSLRLAGEQKQRVQHWLVERVALEDVGEIH